MRKILKQFEPQKAPACLFCPLLVCLFLSGCVAGGGSLAATSTPGALAGDMDNTQTVLARAQQPDGDGKKPPFNPPQVPPVAPSFPELAPPTPGMLQLPGAAISGSSDVIKINVRAWVNGKPLYDDEFILFHPNYDNLLRRISASPNDPKLRETIGTIRDLLIDMELMYQDACYKLEKMSPKSLEKLKKEADKKYEERLTLYRENFKKARPATVSDAEYSKKEALFLRDLRNLSCLIRRQAERQFIGEEYMKSRIVPKLFSLIGPTEIKQEYESHKNQYIYPGKLKWQDVFIPIREHHDSLVETRKYAERLLSHYRDDFKSMLLEDKGDSKNRGGYGIGTHPTYKRDNKIIPTDVRPAEIEPRLIKLRDGETTIVEMPTGVHIVRLVKYEESYQREFTKEVQIEIRNKLRTELFERERKDLIRELRARADIIIIGD